jgi:hypothetical protein
MRDRQAIMRFLHILTFTLSTVALFMPLTSNASDWRSTRWVVECIDPPDCEPANQIIAEQLSRASEWLEGLGFEEPAAFSNLDLNPNDQNLEYWIANISDSDVAKKGLDLLGVYDAAEEMIWLTSDNYFNLGNPGESHDDLLYKLRNVNTILSVHELFHAVQNSVNYKIPLEYEYKWLKEGTAVAVQLDYALSVESDTDPEFSTGMHKNPLHEPGDDRGNYLTAGFWIFLGKQLGSTPRTAYLNELFRNDKLPGHNGIAGVDDFLKNRFSVEGDGTTNHGGLARYFPLYLAALPFEDTFGEPDAWQLQLPVNKKSISKVFSGRVREIAGTAGKLSVPHHPEKVVEISIEIEGEDSDLHLIVDGAVQKFGPGGQRNIFRSQLKDRDETFKIVVAEVADNAIDSTDRNFNIKVTLKELIAPPCGFQAEVGAGVPMSGHHEGPARLIWGKLAILSDPKTGWEARVEIPGKTTGSYDTTFQAAAIIVDAPGCPGCAEFWQSNDAKLEITAIDTDRKSGFVEGGFSGVAKWLGGGSTGDAKPFTVNVKQFRAVSYGVRSTSASSECVEYWQNR